MARLKDLEWELPADDGRHGLTWQQVEIAVLMDIRDELKRINRVIQCPNFLLIPRTLSAIRRNTAKPKRKKKK